jgi:ABC-type amino acid transport substrate-binding protein
MVLALFVIGAFYTYDLGEQVDRDEANLRTQRELDATLKQQLVQANATQREEDAIRAIPHVKPDSRNLTTISDHVTVAWDYQGSDHAKFTTYAIELRKLQSGAGSKCSDSELNKQCTPNRTIFTATDPVRSETRIPPSSSERLDPGSYLWRVAPVPVASALNDTDLLSHWSTFNAITIYGNVDQRVRETKTIRVGTNLEQNSNFSRLDGQGRVTGLDIALIYAVIRGCLRLDTQNNIITFVPSLCKQYTQQKLDAVIDAHIPNQPCIPEDRAIRYAHLCVTMVPVREFGDWQTALLHHNIDLFIGSLTSAGARESSGIKFSHGYFTFHTNLYIPPPNSRIEAPTIETWLGVPRKIGVIEASSNEVLLDDLIETQPTTGRPPRIKKFHYPSFPSLENALESGEVDGVLIDDTFMSHSTWIPLSGLSRTHGWELYKRDYLGDHRSGDTEAFAIATCARETSQSDSTELLRAIDNALDSTDISDLVPKLYDFFWSARR